MKNNKTSKNGQSSMVNNKLKIVFFGAPDFVGPVLKKLEENFEVVEKIRAPQQFNSETIEQLSVLNPDLFVVASYGQILSSKILKIPGLGAINIHPSLLPKYRGPSPIQTAILNGDKKTGVTFIKMDEEIDHGPIISQFEEPILDSDTFEILAKRLFEKSAEILVTVVNHFAENQTTEEQDDSKATYTKTLTKQDGYINLNSTSAFKIENLKLKIKAFYPWPGTWTKFEIRSTKSEIIKLLPGGRIQVEGKRPMSYKDFINGYEKGKFFLEKLSLI